MFQIGDKIMVVDEAIEGVVLQFSADSLLVETTDGFTLDFHPSEVVKIGKSIQVTNFQVAQVKSTKDSSIQKKSIFTEKKKNQTLLEVDLHIEKLSSSWRSMDAYDILNLQVETAKRQLDFAISKQIHKVVFIHGHGEGVLKKELEFLLNKYTNATYGDAPYRKYGMGGATEVLFG